MNKSAASGIYKTAPLVAALFMLAVSPIHAGEAVSNPAILRSEFINKNAAYPQCHASTIAEASSGRLVAAWFGGTKEKAPDVCIWVSYYENGRWSDGINVANGVQPDGRHLPTWNPVLFQPPQSGAPLILFYKVGPSPETWWGMMMTSSDSGRTWSKPVRLPDGILGPIKNKPVALADGTWISPSSTENREAGWRVHFEYSRDLGKTWAVARPVQQGVSFDAIQPSVLSFSDGRLEALCRTKQGVVAMTWSSDNGITWSPLAATALPNPNSGTDAVTLTDGRQLLVYNHAAHEPGRPGKGLRYPLNIALSEDGLNWKPVLVLESASIRHGYAYPAVIQASGGLVHVTYTWNRQFIKHVVIDPAKL